MNYLIFLHWYVFTVLVFFSDTSLFAENPNSLQSVSHNDNQEKVNENQEPSKENTCISSNTINTGVSDEEWTEPTTGIKFVRLHSGAFQMGAELTEETPSEKGTNTVHLDDFWLGKYEITQGEWKKIMGSNPSYFKKGDNYPVETVSWYDTQLFITRLNEQHEGRYTFRLPTEAEWEYAARSGGKGKKWAGTNKESELEFYAWYSDNSGGSTHPVGQKRPNELGLYDMSGNVWEWVEDTYLFDTLRLGIETIYTDTGDYRIMRGGSWDDLPWFLRCTFRDYDSPSYRYNCIGLRLARSP